MVHWALNFADRRYVPANRRARFWGRNIARAGYYGGAAVASKLGYSGYKSYIKNGVAPSYPSAAVYPSRRRGRRSTAIRPKRGLKKKVRELARVVNATNGTLIYRKRNTSKLLPAVNAMAQTHLQITDMASMELVLAELRYFDPAAPGTLVQASGATGTYSRDYLFKSIYSNAQAVNNYQIPVKVTLYVVTPKQDTSIAPITAFTNGLTDVGNPTVASQLVHLTDSEEFNDLWKIQKSISKILQPGQSCNITHSAKNIMYSPATFDSHNLAYQRRFGVYLILARAEGVLAHDTVEDEQGFSPAGLDLSCDTKWTVEYDAGIDIKFIVLAETADTFTTSAVMSNKPVSDNQAFSKV